jgi:hypothetical protein
MILKVLSSNIVLVIFLSLQLNVLRVEISCIKRLFGHKMLIKFVFLYYYLFIILALLDKWRFKLSLFGHKMFLAKSFFSLALKKSLFTL